MEAVQCSTVASEMIGDSLRFLNLSSVPLHSPKYLFFRLYLRLVICLKKQLCMKQHQHPLLIFFSFMKLFISGWLITSNSAFFGSLASCIAFSFKSLMFALSASALIFSFWYSALNFFIFSGSSGVSPLSPFPFPLPFSMVVSLTVIPFFGIGTLSLLGQSPKIGTVSYLVTSKSEILNPLF